MVFIKTLVKTKNRLWKMIYFFIQTKEKVDIIDF